MNANCEICKNPLLQKGGGRFVRVGPNAHAHAACMLRAENEEGHFDDAPCVQCEERLSKCQCCPNCAATEHSGWRLGCGVCYDYQQDNYGPDPAFAQANIEVCVNQALERGCLN